LGGDVDEVLHASAYERQHDGGGDEASRPALRLVPDPPQALGGFHGGRTSGRRERGQPRHERDDMAPERRRRRVDVAAPLAVE
jgi:hypothetical protein